MNILEIKNLHLSYGDSEVLKGIDLNIEEGEFLTILGPSGCGKTTLLNTIAGHLKPNTGSVFLDGVDITNVNADKRDINTIFQSYALFPLMTVEQNIAYGLKIRKIPKDEIKRRVKVMLEIIDMEGFQKRLPSELSGGQQQRVAIARALILEPKVLLLDEPLGALDSQLRRKMQIELRKLQKKMGITFVFITHDQDEAIYMSDRIATMDKGIITKLDEPVEIFRIKDEDLNKNLSRIDFVMENGERVVVCKKGIDNCIEYLEKIKMKWETDSNEEIS